MNEDPVLSSSSRRGARHVAAGWGDEGGATGAQRAWRAMRSSRRRRLRPGLGGDVRSGRGSRAAEAWPSMRCSTFTSAPAAMASEAQQCRISCRRRGAPDLPKRPRAPRPVCGSSRDVGSRPREPGRRCRPGRARRRPGGGVPGFGNEAREGGRPAACGGLRREHLEAPVEALDLLNDGDRAVVKVNVAAPKSDELPGPETAVGGDKEECLIARVDLLAEAGHLVMGQEAHRLEGSGRRLV